MGALVEAAPFISAAGTIFSGVSQFVAGQRNASVYGAQAEAEQEAARFEESKERQRIKRLIASQRAAIGASGLEPTGTPLELIKETASEGEKDALAIRYGGKVRRARALDAAGTSRRTGTSALVGSFFNAGSSLLTSGIFDKKK